MPEFETKKASGSVAKGACYGNWSQYHPACPNCMVWCDCKRVTAREKRKLAEKAKAEENPIDYMLGILRKSYTEERKFGNEASAHCFKNSDGVKTVVVWVAKSGKVKIKTKKGEVTFDSLESGKHVREILSTNKIMKGFTF